MKYALPLAAYVLAGLAVIGIVLLAALGRPVPDLLGYIAVGGTTGGLGATPPARAGKRASDR